MARFTESIPDLDRWAQSIGGLIINFGCLEFQTMRWIQVFGGEEAAIQAKQYPLSKRIDVSLSLMETSTLHPDIKQKAHTLWDSVRQLSKMRNQIAHNPIALGRNDETGETAFSIVDLKKMTPFGENKLDPLPYIEIASSAILARDINRELSSIVESLNNISQSP